MKNAQKIKISALLEKSIRFAIYNKNRKARDLTISTIYGGAYQKYYCDCYKNFDGFLYQ